MTRKTANQKAGSNYDHNCSVTNDLLYSYKTAGFLGYKQSDLVSVALTVNTGVSNCRGLSLTQAITEYARDFFFNSSSSLGGLGEECFFTTHGVFFAQLLNSLLNKN